MDPSLRDDALDDLADRLRAQLVREAADPRRTAAMPADLHVRDLVEREAAVLDAATREELRRRVADRSFGLGPLEPLLGDPSVDEIMVNGTRPVWVERRGRLEVTPVRFATDADLLHAIERILAPVGRRVDEAQPLCDARLPDGARVNVVLPPLAIDGPTLTVRRFRQRALDAAQLVACGTWSQPVHDLLRAAVGARLNVLVSGGTGSGKTTTLNALSAFVGPMERIVTIEDTAELRLQQPHVVRLEARPPNVEGAGEITIRRLVRNALRMRPDRIVVGEVRGAEALDMLMAMASGHDGSLSTVHASSAAEALRRVEILALMADVGLPHVAVREQVAGAIDVIVHQERAADGVRRVTAVCEVISGPDGPLARALLTARGDRVEMRPPSDPRLAGAARMTMSALLAGLAGACAVSAAHEVLQTAPRAWGSARLPSAIGAPWRAAGQGVVPTGHAERRRLAVLAALAAGAAGWLLAGPVGGVLVATAGPAVAHRALRARRARWRARVVEGAPHVCRALADALAGGRSVRGALLDVAATGGTGASADGELRCIAAALVVGAPTEQVLRDWAARVDAPAYDLLVAAILLQAHAGGDLAALLRTLAGDLEETRRAAADARAATAQARFTAGVVLALPAAAVAVTQLAAPGTLAAVLAAPLPRLMIVASLVLDVLAVLAMRRLARVPG